MSPASHRPPVHLPSGQEDKAITAAARSDPDAQVLTPEQLKAMVPLQKIRPHTGPGTPPWPLPPDLAAIPDNHAF